MERFKHEAEGSAARDFASNSGAGDARSDASGDARTAPRFALLLRAAKLIADEREFLCILRDASATGVKVRLFHDMPAHRELELELGNGERLPLTLVWQDGEHAGLRFHHLTDVQRFLDDSNATYPRRQIRLRLSLPALVQSGGITAPIAFRDISQQGACIESDKHLLMNELVRIDVENWRPIYAKVRWRRAPLYGLIFEHPFKLDELARAAAPMQLTQGAEAKPHTVARTIV